MHSRILLQTSEDDPDVAYVYFPDDRGPVAKEKACSQIRLSDLVGYIGPDIYFDIDSSGRLLGMEILA